MNIDINGQSWSIIEVDEKDDRLKVDDKECWGTCKYDCQHIYLCKQAMLGKKKQTLIHELSHAFVYEYLLKIQESYDNEDLCEFVAKYGERIVLSANKYFEVKYKYTKGC